MKYGLSELSKIIITKIFLPYLSNCTKYFMNSSKFGAVIYRLKYTHPEEHRGPHLTKTNLIFIREKQRKEE